MDSIEKIIHGIDVSKCSHYNPLGNYNCSGTKKCSQWSNCYFKQLQRKTAECEELETMVAEAKEAPICFRRSEEPCIRQERDKYKKLSVVFKDVNKQLGYKYITLKQALDEIEENIKAMNNECFYDDICDCNNCDMKNGCSYYRKFKILNIINKVKENN